MCEIMNYIFESINKQARYNRKISVFTLAMTINMVLLELDRIEQKKRIEKLETIIEEMNRDKGE